MTERIEDSTCCIVGAGPAGALLGLLLARSGVQVVLLESQGDFDRDFRGDSLHPAILEVLDQVGLADELLSLPHTRIRSLTLPGGTEPSLSFDDLDSRFPFMTLMPQRCFLEFVTEEAAKYPTFQLVMNAPVRELIRSEGRVVGVRYDTGDGTGEVRADLTVGADGRTSTVRRQAGLEAVTYGSTIDVLWLRLPRRSSDPEGIIAGSARHLMMLAADRGDQWQVGVIIPKGGYRSIRAERVATLRETIAEALPVLGDRVGDLDEWRQVAMLSVRADRVKRWHRPGLLLIGDAAHVMSPVAGNGINYAIADAVAAHNLLAGPLAEGSITDKHLAAVQRRRDWPTRVTQFSVARAQNRLLAGFSKARARPPAFVRWALRIPWVPRQAIRIAAYGLRPERIQHPDVEAGAGNGIRSEQR
jgi:2-polyprenyl-6-methoxyphenol hydroxylase-like FAD-dependent oxidoreductase